MDNQYGPGVGSGPDQELRKRCEGRLMGLRVNRYSFWVHWRELADYILPRRYKWLITPNQMGRGSPINQHILDSTGTLAARNLASGLMSGCSDPTKRWFRLSIGHIDSTQTSPISLWLAECERLLLLIFQESNFYNAIATVYFDLVIFGSAVLLIYEDFENVISCFTPCAGEYYLDSSDTLEVDSLYREFTYTVFQAVQRFGLDKVSPSIARLYKEGGSSWTRELVVAHAIEPNTTPGKFGIPSHFKYRECYWEWGGSASPQGGSSYAFGLLHKGGFHEAPMACPRWDLVSNDAYGRSPAMDALPDVKQLQLEVRRKAQAIDKVVNPPMVADIQLKNQPASLLPGGVTYIAGMMANAHPGFSTAYGNWRPDIGAMSEDLQEVRKRIQEIFFVPLFQTASQYETRSNVTALEWDMRKAESMVMLGPVLERIDRELLRKAVERTFAIAVRAGIVPPAPADVQGREVTIRFVSMLEQAQAAAAMGGIERIFQLAGSVAGIDPQVFDGIDVDYGIAKSSHLLNNDPRLIRAPQELAQIRQQRQQQMAAQQQAEMANKLAPGAKVLADTQVGGGQGGAPPNALAALMGGGR